MSELAYARSFRDLVVYQRTKAVTKEIFELTRTFPKEETFSLTDQVRRSSRSVGAQIAEAWGKRRYEKHFVSKLTDADAEQLETQHWLDSALDCEYLTADRAKELNAALAEIGKMLGGIITKAELFCQHDPKSVREDTAEYFT